MISQENVPNWSWRNQEIEGECENAVMKLKFEEAIAVPESQRNSVAESIDFHSILNVAS